MLATPATSSCNRDASPVMNIKSPKGWRRVGIVVSVIWFLGFGFYVWNHELESHSDFYMFETRNCTRLLDMANENLQYARTQEERDRRFAENFAKHRACDEKALAFLKE